jgi:hypothetical protein
VTDETSWEELHAAVRQSEREFKAAFDKIGWPSRQEQVDRLCALAGVREDGGIEPSPHVAIDRTPKSWWKNPVKS